MTILILSLPVLLILAAFGAELWILPRLRDRIGSHRTSK